MDTSQAEHAQGPPPAEPGDPDVRPDDAATASAPERLWRRAVVGGTLVAGLVAGTSAWRSPVAPSRPSLPGWSRVNFVVACAGLVTLAIPGVTRMLTELDERRRGRSVGRGIAVVSAAVAGAGAAYTGWQVTVDVGSGLPEREVPLMAMALLVLAGGAAVRATPGGHAAASSGRGRGRLVSVGAMLMVGSVATALSTGLAAQVEGLPHDATTAARSQPLALHAPTQVAWSRVLPGGHHLDHSFGTLLAGGGFVVPEGDGLVVLDGTTGDERWHHRWTGASLDRLWTNQAGTWIVARFEPGNRPDQGGRYVVLDAATGQVAWDLTRAPGVGDHIPWGNVMGLTDDVLVLLSVDDPDRSRSVAIDLATGEHLWSRDEPAEGEPGGSCGASGLGHPDFDAVAPDTILLQTGCSDERALVGIDDRTGRERWRYLPDVPGGADIQGYAVELSPGGAAAHVRSVWSDGREDQGEQVVLDPSTGEVLLSPAQMADRPLHPAGAAPGRRDRIYLDEPPSDTAVLRSTDVDGSDEGGDGLTDWLVQVADIGGAVTEAEVPDCGFSFGGTAVVDGSLVVVCSGAPADTDAGDQEPFVWVAPLDDPGDGHRIDVETEVASASTMEVPRLYVGPGVLAVVWPYGDRLTVLR
jgi:outer membrane protein assembly factor BamB